MKKRKDFFNRYLDEIYDVSNMLRQQGKSYAECRYLEIVAVLLLFVNEELRMIGCGFAALLGFFFGLIIRGMFGS